MHKYVVSSGKSILSKINDSSYEFCTKAQNSIIYNSIGDAMRAAIKVNEFNNSNSFRVIPVADNL